MSPAQLNEQIRADAWFYIDQDETLKQLRVLKARSVKGKVQVCVELNGKLTWRTVTAVRPAGSNHHIPLFAEGAMTWAIN